jgi:hypothetical protein
MLLKLTLRNGKRVKLQNGLSATIFPLSKRSLDFGNKEESQQISDWSPIYIRLMLRGGTLVKIALKGAQICLVYNDLQERKELLQNLQENLAQALEKAFLITYKRHIYYKDTRTANHIVEAIKNKVNPNLVPLLFSSDEAK